MAALSTTMSRVQQIRSMDEITCAEIGEAWMTKIVADLDPTQLPGEIKVSQADDDTTVRTLWLRNQPVAIEVRQRCEFNCTVMTLVEITPNK